MSNRKRLLGALVSKMDDAFEADSVLLSGKSSLTRKELRLLERKGLVEKRLASNKGTRVFEWRQCGEVK